MNKKSVSLLLLGLASIAAAHAQFAPLSLTPESYNYDVVVEKAAGLPAPATTASMDGGTNNTGFTWYEAGFNVDAPDTGLPAAGTTVTSTTLPDHNYTFAPSYTAANAILVDAGVSNATYTVTAPTAVSALSFLGSAGNGATTNNVVIHHADGSSETAQMVISDWFSDVNIAFTANGRVDAISRGLDNVNNNFPRLLSVDVPVSNTTSPVTSIDFERVGGGHSAIFAVSASNGADFTALAGTGFNYDMVVEAGADQQPTDLAATTATLDAGVDNTDYTWYERGVYAPAPLTGLPAAGQTITNAAAADHVYRLAPSYTENNAILIDNTTAPTDVPVTVTFAAPVTASGLSLLGSSGGGAVTINFTLHHNDNTTQTGTFVVPDWFNATPVAYTVNGRINAKNGGFQAINSNNPRIYGVDVAVANTASPITSIDLSVASGGGHAAIMAISSSAGAIKPIFDLQPASTNILEGGTIQLDSFVSGTAPFTYRWQSGANGTFTDLANGNGFSGVATTNLVLTGATANAALDYRLIASNAAGSSTGAVVRINVVSTKTDVTTPSDTVTIFGGTAPNNESEVNAINDDTSKYLNFGTDGNTDAGFTGPVGVDITLANGPAVVTGLRIYTANDATERDPVDFKLEGSNDGTTFTTVASGPLSLPTARNAAGQAIDENSKISLANTEVRFSNSAGYATYRLTFNNVRNNTTANSVQIGEVELLGTLGVGSASLGINRNADGTLTITSSGAGTLESTTSLNPPVTWTNEGPIEGSTTVNATGSMRFFRVVQ
jgi:hypothetical protein